MLTTTLHPSFQTPIDNQIDDITVDPKRLLMDLLQTDSQLMQVAEAHGLALQQLVVWIQQPGVQALLDECDAVAARIAAHKAAQARPGAIQALVTQTMLIETVKERETAAKACRAILRIPIRETEPTEAPLAHIGRLTISRPARPSRPPRSHPANPKRARSLIPTDPTFHTPHDSISIPVYRFRPNSKDPIGPIRRMGPIGPIQPYELLDPDTAPTNGTSQPSQR